MAMKFFLYKLFPILKVKAEIRKIEKQEFSNYKGKKMIGIGILHKQLRKRIGDKQFLLYLQQQSTLNPMPQYQPPKFDTDAKRD